MTEDNRRTLDDVASAKRDKEMEVTRMLSDFRKEKEALLDKQQKERHKADDLLRDQQIKSEEQIQNLKNKAVFQKLDAQKTHEEIKEALVKEVDKLSLKVADLTEKTTREGSELENAIDEKGRLYQEFQKVSEMNNAAQNELHQLRKVRNELTAEREDLIGDLQGHVSEIENVYQINRELKAKIKRLEQVIYGKNMKKK